MGDQAHSSVTDWLGRLRGGDQAAAQQLWNAYFCRLVGLARKKLEGRSSLIGDEEDVALSAIKSFCRGIERGRFPRIVDHGDLWNLLVTITLHKVLHLVRDEGRAKRGGSRRPTAAADDSDSNLLEQLVGAEPIPEMAVQVAEEAERLLAQLPSQELVELALLKMEGYTNPEIANRWQQAERTVERKLNLIRRLWSTNFSPPSDRSPASADRNVILSVVAGPNQGQRFVFDHNDTIFVGRGPAAHLKLPPGDKSLSRLHFQVEIVLPGCRLTNLSKTNGTLVNGRKVSVADLRHGDIILAGDTAIRVEIQ